MLWVELIGIAIYVAQDQLPAFWNNNNLVSVDQSGVWKYCLMDRVVVVSVVDSTIGLIVSVSMHSLQPTYDSSSTMQHNPFFWNVQSDLLLFKHVLPVRWLYLPIFFSGWHLCLVAACVPWYFISPLCTHSCNCKGPDILRPTSSPAMHSPRIGMWSPPTQQCNSLFWNVQCDLLLFKISPADQDWLWQQPQWTHWLLPQ